MEEIILAIARTFGVGSIIAGIVIFKINKSEKKRENEDQARAEENIIIITGLKAIGHLAEATALAQKTGEANGAMDKALEYYKEFGKRLNNYLLRQNAEKNHGR